MALFSHFKNYVCILNLILSVHSSIVVKHSECPAVIGLFVYSNCMRKGSNMTFRNHSKNGFFITSHQRHRVTQINFGSKHTDRLVKKWLWVELGRKWSTRTPATDGVPPKEPWTDRKKKNPHPNSTVASFPKIHKSQASYEKTVQS